MNTAACTHDATAWYVAHTKPRQEAIAQENLLRQEFEVYLPRFKVFKKRGRTAKGAVTATHEPMFPRYLFFRPTRPTQSLSVVRSTTGVSRLVMFGTQPALLADNAVQAIRQAEALRDTADIDQISPIQAGMTVQIQDSPLAGVHALVQSVSKDRVTLLLTILGRPQTVQVEWGQISPS